MKKPLEIVLWVSGIVAAGFVGLLALGFWILSSIEYRFPDGANVRAHVAGRWDWSTRGRPCTDSAHAIAFGGDGATMTIDLEYPSDSTAGRKPVVYDIREVTAGRIRGAIRGETRKTDAGAPVVWDLVVTGPDEYRWHRTDWAASGFTAPVRRCGPPTTSPG